MKDIHSLLVLPHLHIQNANSISSPMTWGFPSMSAFVGLMHALERNIPESIGLIFESVGVICHRFEAQVADSFPRAFRLTRNPVDKNGKTAAIVEEGRIHLEITLVFAVRGNTVTDPETACQIADLVAGMRIAGGSVISPIVRPCKREPQLIALDENADARNKQFMELKRQWLPGFTLVLRDDLLQQRLTEMQTDCPGASLLDAWLDLSRLNIECSLVEETDERGETNATSQWLTRRPPGWIVPIPIGYGALSDLLPVGDVTNSRDSNTPFRFVESLYSVGQWISPHRLEKPQDFLWYVDNDLDNGVYRLRNNYRLNNIV